MSYTDDKSIGNAEVTFDCKIDSIGAIKEVERILQKEEKIQGSVIIINYQLMKEE